MSNYLSDKGYVALKPQVAAGTPIIPTHFFPLVSESIKVNPGFTADRRIKGLSWKSDELLKGTRKIEGDFVVMGDPDALGHLLNMCYLKGSSTGSAPVGYTHPFTVGEGKSYSVEIARGIYAQRFWGVRADQIKLDFVDNKLQATASIKALGQFYSASLAIAQTGAGMTSAVLSTDYDLRPTDGLAVGDVVVIGGVSLTLLTVAADGKTITYASTAVTAAVGDPVYLLAQTPSYGSVEPLYMGNALVGIAATSAAAVTAAGSKATASPCYNFSAAFKNNLLDTPATGSTGASALLNQAREASCDVSQLFSNPTQFQKWIEFVKQAITMIVTGRFIKSDLTTSEQLTVNWHKVKLMTNDEPLEVGAYLFDKQTYEALYDAGDAMAIDITLINRTAGTDY